MKEKYLKILYWIVLIALAFSIVLEVSAEEFDTVHPIDKDGQYTLQYEEMIPRENVGILIAADGKLHLYYLENELVNVYASTGEFLYGFQFPDCQNGVSNMHYENCLLYVDDRGSGIYVFRDTELVRFEERHYQNEGHDELEALFTGVYPHTDGEYTYVYEPENNQIIRYGNGTSEVLIRFPQKSPHINGLLLLLGGWILAGCFYSDMEKGRFPPHRV